MEKRASNTFVLLVLVALARCSVADEATTTSVSTPHLTSSTPEPVSVDTHQPAPSSSAATDIDLAAAVTQNAANNGSTVPVQIEVFYEAMCSDSVNFVQNQLFPTYNKFKKFINVSFIPFGQGNITKSDDGSYKLTCPRTGECAADQVHACGIKYITDHDKLMKFVNCSLVEGFKNQTVPIELCGSNSNLEKTIIDSIKTCIASNTTSYELLQHYHQLSLENKVQSVPKIVINRNYSETTQQLSLKNLEQVVCNVIPTSDSPAECKHTDSGSSTVVIGILPLLISVYYFIRMF